MTLPPRTSRAVTDAQRRSFDRRYRWLLLRGLRVLRGIQDTDLSQSADLDETYGVCRDAVLELARAEGWKPEELDFMKAQLAIDHVVTSLVAQAAAL